MGSTVVNRAADLGLRGARFLVVRTNCDELREGMWVSVSRSGDAGSGSYGRVFEVAPPRSLPTAAVVKVGKQSQRDRAGECLAPGFDADDFFLGDLCYERFGAEYERMVSAAADDVCPRTYAFGVLREALGGSLGCVYSLSPAIIMQDMRADGYITLREAVESGALEATARSAAEVGLLLLEKLERLYRRGRPILHHDLSDTNVMVLLGKDAARDAAFAEGLMLIDFGQASYEGDQVTTVLDSRPCTPEFASPETLQLVYGTLDGEELDAFRRIHKGKNALASDIYSTGPLMFEVRKARRPRLTDREDTASNLRDKRSGKYIDLAPFADEADARLSEVIKGCAQFEPKDRWGFERIYEGLGGIVPPTARGAWARVLQPARGGGLRRLSHRGAMVSYIGENYKWEKFDLDSRPAYIADFAGCWPLEETDAHLVGYGDAGILNILYTGYPFTNIFGNDDLDRFITQAAVWAYMADMGIGERFDTDFTSYSADPYSARPVIEELVKAAHATRAAYSKKNAIYTINFPIGGDETVPLTPCLFALGDSEAPRVVALRKCGGLPYAVPDVEAEGFDLITAEGFKEPVEGFARSGPVIGGNECRVYREDKEGCTPVLIEGDGLSNSALSDLLVQRRRAGEIPRDSPVKVAISPCFPTPEMWAKGVRKRSITYRRFDC